MSVQTGLDILVAEDFRRLHGKSIGLVCNQASCDRQLRHILDLLLPLHRRQQLNIQAVFGPQHGLFGHTQDNMIEWEGMRDERTGLTVYSLYGAHREPQPCMLSELDELIVDLQDVGSRYYTFVWTMALCMKACESASIPVTVLDRPNPIGGLLVEGPTVQSGLESFVGQYSLPTRHGMSIGEVAKHLQQAYFPRLELNIAAMQGWSRDMYWEQTGLPWILPSPNMPTVDTAVVYPGGCLLEATNLSEGRGTTKPFEIFGAPFLYAWKFSDALNGLNLPGCRFRPITFQPTFNKHAGKICGGCQLHVQDRSRFQPVLTYVGIMQEAVRQSSLHQAKEKSTDRFVADSHETELPGFAWRLPPYEYVYDRRPIDILAGNEWLESAVSNLDPLERINERMRGESEEFGPAREAALLY